MENKQNFKIKGLKKDPIVFLKFHLGIWQCQFKVSFPYFKVSDWSYEFRERRVNRFDSKEFLKGFETFQESR